MSDWTEEERVILRDLWEKLDVNEIGHQAVSRFLLVYPWTHRYFKTFGKLDTKEEILSNPNVAKHGETVMSGLKNALNNLDNLRSSYRKLRNMHAEKLHIDPDNFRLLGSCLTVCVAAEIGGSFSITIQDAWQKFITEVVSALGGQFR